MKKQLLLLLTCLGFATLSLAQNTTPSLINLKGTVTDTTNTTLPMATVMLLNNNDNKLIYYTHTDKSGVFSFNNIKNDSYILKVNYLCFYPFLKKIQPATLTSFDIGVIRMKPIAQVLQEVVIKAAQAEITFHGDTVEYNAASFKVPPGSKVEDLLRLLPGIDVDPDGNISTQGKTINTVYVNGNKFFGDNPKIATKNLGAEAVSKVQMYNEKSQNEKLTGIKDADREKVLNLALKKEYNNSAFGSIGVGIGTKEMWKTTGMYNRFNDKWQLSFLGLRDNTKMSDYGGLSYSSFKGKGSSYFGDNGDFGFAISGKPTLTSYAFDIPDDKGYVNNYGGGTNYNYLGKKTKISTSYVFNQIVQDINQYGNKITYLKENNSLFNTDTSYTMKLMKKHTFETAIQTDIDENNDFIAKVSMNLMKIENRNNQNQMYSSSADVPLYSINHSQFSNGDSWDIKSHAIYAHRFKREGQSLSFSAGFNSVKSNNNETSENLNQFYNATTLSEQMSLLNTNQSIAYELKSSLLFTQPIFKNGYLETFYNIDHQSTSTDKQVDNTLFENTKIDSLSSYFQSSSLLNRLGTIVHVTNEKLDLNIGLAGQSIDLSGKQSFNGNYSGIPNLTQKNYLHLIPSLSCTLHPGKKSLFTCSYTSGIRLPQISDLSPEPRTNNPLFIFYGNPYLKPVTTNNFSCSFNASFPLHLSGTYATFKNQIVLSQSIQPDYRTIYRPMNISGGDRISGGIDYRLNIYKNIYKVSFSAYGSRERSFAYVNNILNDTRNSTITCNVAFVYSPLAKLRFSLYNKLSYTYFTYSINSERSQYFTNHSSWLSIYYQISKKIYFINDLKYSVYQNDQFDIHRKMPLWYATLKTTAGKMNHFEITLTAKDILAKQVNINQTGMLNYFETQYTASVTRYFMLSIAYNLKGFSN